jgi:2-keto-4-pentenoate hydratase
VSEPIHIQSLAREIKTAQDSKQLLTLLSARMPQLDMTGAYEIAQQVHSLRLAQGQQPVGRKIGFTNPDMWERYGVRQPVWGYMYHHTVKLLDSSTTSFSLAHLMNPKIEPEIVLHFHAAPPVGADAGRVLQCIDWIAMGFEIVHCHYADWKFQASDAVADAAFHGALLVGVRQPVAALGDDVLAALQQFSLTLSCDGQAIETGRGSNVLGNPLAAMAHLVAVLAQQSGYAPVRAGDMVTTGTLTAAYTVQAGQTWHTEQQGINLPSMSVNFTA